MLAKKKGGGSISLAFRHQSHCQYSKDPKLHNTAENVNPRFTKVCQSLGDNRFGNEGDSLPRTLRAKGRNKILLDSLVQVDLLVMSKRRIIQRH